MNKLRMALVALMAACVGGTASIGYGCFMRSPQPVQVWLDHINVEIRDQVAVKTYNCTFKNPNAQAVVGGECFMELEPGAQVDNMTVTVDGKNMQAEILDVEKANEVFTDIVKNGGSPALLEYYGNQLITTKVPRIAPNGTVTVKLTYTTVLKKKGNVVRLQMLNTNPKASMQPLKSASVSVKIKSKEALKNIYSPTHKIKIEEDKDWDVVANWSQENYLPRHPFVLYYATDSQKVGASLVAHREFDEDGSFMLMLSPTVGNGSGQITDKDVLPKDVVFCVDTSGSMLQGNKIAQAKTALKYCIEHLREGDRFNIVDFSTAVRSFHEDGLIEFNPTTKRKALTYADRLAPRGGTAIQEALDLSLEHLGKSNRLQMVLFATDGLPTIGERDPEAILKNMAKKNTENVRMFVFGEGFDVNTKLLDFLAINHRGEADYILPEEDISKKISQFFDRVGSPIMTDVKVQFDGLKVKDVHPKQIDDIFRGEQVILYGRYSGHGSKTVTVTGNVNGETKTFTYNLNFPEISEDDRGSFVPRLWAGKKVDYLLSEIRKTAKPEKELVDEVTYLAKRYGIVTPYTAYLMTDDVANKDQAQLAQQFNRGLATPGFAGRGGFGLGGGGNFGNGGVPGSAKKPSATTAPQRPGSGATSGPAGDLDRPESEEAQREAKVRDSKALGDARRAKDESGAADADYEYAERLLRKYDKAGGKNAMHTIRYIGSRTFYQSAGVWYDSEYNAQKDKAEKTLKVGSPEFLELLKTERRIAKYLALGDVVIKVKGEWVRIKK